MKKILPLFILLLGNILVMGQNKELTLEDAILKQRTELAPKNIRGLQWIADESALCYQAEDGQAFVRRSSLGQKQEELIPLADIAKATGLEIKRLPRITWTSKDEFYFRHEGNFHYYNTSSKKATKGLSFTAKAANVDYHSKSKRAAYTIDHNLYIMGSDGNSIPVVTVENPNIVSGQAIARFEFGIQKGTFWSPKGNMLAFYQKDESEVGDYPLLDISSAPGKLRTIKYPMAGQGSESASVGVYNLATEALVYLKVDGPKDQYLTNVGWGPNEEFIYVAVVNRDQNQMWLNKYDAKTGEMVKTLFEEKHPKYVEPENPVWFAEGKTGEFFWMSERDGFNHVYRYSTDGELLGQVTKGKWVVTGILGLSGSGKNLIVTGTDETGLNAYAYAVDIASGEKKNLSEGSGVHRYQLSADGIHLIDSYSSIRTPRVIDIVNTRGKKVTNLLAATNPLREYNISMPELIKLKADNGVDLHARVIKPSNFEERKKYPVLVYVYGGPHAQMVNNSWLARAPLWMYYMAEKGYIVFTVDGRGSANRGFDFENTIHRRLGEVEMRDQLVGVKYLKGLPYVDANRMAVHGWSYGGFMTTSLMLREPGVFQVGVAGGPVTDWKYYEVMYGERYMDRPEENADGYQKASLLNYTKNLEGKLLLIHGTVDDVVVMQHSLDLIRHFVDNGKQVDFFPYPMHPHNVRGKDRVHLMQKVLDYVDENLKID